ncbi:hypothetical protein [Herbiconiux liangxiaofengii]|uniref:hypothetical protein n=1 Tax=Herbiconiux liangxiaofengii TaxID=3342795 RepID=UPI0035B894F9
MFRKNIVRVSAVGVIAAALVAGSAVAAHAADEPVPTTGSKGPYYIGDAGDGSIIPAGTELDFDYALIGMPSADPADIEAVFPGSSDAETVRTFISPRGSERTPSQWTAWADSGFKAGTKDMIYPAATLGAQVLGNQSTVRAGGNFSVGFAFMKNNNLTIATGDVYYANITVLPNGKWKFATPDGGTTPPPATANSFDVNLQATTTSAPDGTLSLVAPASNTAVIANPTLVDGLSTSTGTLGAFSIVDERYQTHPGWTLTTTVTPFTNAADASKIIDPKQLGVAPKLVEPNSAVTLANAQTAGSATYPSVFAQTGNAAASGTVKLNADLKFVSPANYPAGTYTSKLTLTLASK